MGLPQKFISIRRRQSAGLMMELVVAMAILAATMIPISFSFFGEQKLLRVYYQRAIAMEILDGEMEVLQAGEWRAWPEGTMAYPVQANAAKNLPSGFFFLTRESQHLRLEWQPDRGKTISREGIGL